jgi:hypothetical protein
VWFDEGMKVKEAIKQAIGGKYLGMKEHWTRDNQIIDCEAMTFLDPSFWKSLGTSMGKGLRAIRDIDVAGGPLSRYEYWWQCQWHRFIDHLADGKTAEDFFGELN